VHTFSAHAPAKLRLVWTKKLFLSGKERCYFMRVNAPLNQLLQRGNSGQYAKKSVFLHYAMHNLTHYIQQQDYFARPVLDKPS